MYGRTLLTADSVRKTRVSADGSPEFKTGGVTLDWSKVVAPVAIATLGDGSTIQIGHKYLRYGQVMTKITLPETDSLTITATGGTYTLSVTVAGGTIQTTGALNWNDVAATIQTALQALSQVGSGNATVAGTGPWTISFADSLGAVALTVAVGSLTGGTATIGELASGGNLGWFGPYDSAATDGRQTLTRGEAFVCDQTILQYPSGTGAGLSGAEDQTGGMIEGGAIFLDRILQSGTASATLALGPTLANFLTVFPRFRLVKD